MSTGKQLLIKTVGFFEMSGATCQSTRRNNAGMLTLNPNNIAKFSSYSASRLQPFNAARETVAVYCMKRAKRWRSALQALGPGFHSR